MEVKMDSLHSIMDKRKKGTHLSLEERVIIQTRLKDHCSLRSIAREIGCSPSTIHYEIKRGTVKLITAISNVIKPSKVKAFIKTIVSTVVANLTFSKSTNLLITFNGTSLKMAGHSMSAVIAALLWVNLPAAILSALGRFIIMSIKVC